MTMRNEPTTSTPEMKPHDLLEGCETGMMRGGVLYVPPDVYGRMRDRKPGDPAIEIVYIDMDLLESIDRPFMFLNGDALYGEGC